MKSVAKTGRSASRVSFCSKRTCVICFQAVVMFESLMQLTKSTSFFSPYLLVYLLGFLAFFSGIREGTLHSPWEHRVSQISALFFAFLISAANYPLWMECTLGANAPAVMRIGYKLVMLALILGGSFLAFYSIFRYAASRMIRVTGKEKAYPNSRVWTPRGLFILSFCIISFVYLFVLYFIKYPGLIEADTIDQFYQCAEGKYNNFNPVFSTLAIKPFVTVGMALFHNMNACAAMYFTAQALFAAFSFACVVRILAEMKVSAGLMIGAVLFYALMPYHIMFSIGHSKDVLFSLFVLLFCIVLFRVTKQSVPSVKLCLLLFLVSVGFCVMRNNGILAFLFFIPVYCFVTKMKNKHVSFVLIAALLFSFFITRPMLQILGIPQSDWVESCSLPTQQVARTVIDHDDLTPDEYEALNPIMEVSEIPQTYDPGLSDPIKALTWNTMLKNPAGAQQWRGFMKLWFHLGLRHPITYLKAFVDLTSGYWNSGYDAAPWCNFISENNIGLHLTHPVPILSTLFDHYIGLFDDFFVLQLMICTGLFVWLHLFSCAVCIMRKDKTGIITCAPVLCVVQTLLLGVPVACDLRYIYCAFCALPFILAVAAGKQLD